MRSDHQALIIRNNTGREVRERWEKKEAPQQVHEELTLISADNDYFSYSGVTSLPRSDGTGQHDHPPFSQSERFAGFVAETFHIIQASVRASMHV